MTGRYRYGPHGLHHRAQRAAKHALLLPGEGGQGPILGLPGGSVGASEELGARVDEVPRLQIREMTVPRLDRFVQALQLRNGAATAKLARTVVSGVLGLAVRHGAIATNPARDIARIASRPRPRAPTPEERHRWLNRLGADPDARRKDLPDPCEWMLATGVRIGEAVAVSWNEVDLHKGVVDIEHTLIRLKGVGLIRKGTKSSAGERTRQLPDFALTTLQRRRIAMGGQGRVW